MDYLKANYQPPGPEGNFRLENRGCAGILRRRLRSLKERDEMDASRMRSGFGQTARPDAWWLQPALVFSVLSSFLVYATWAA